MRRLFTLILILVCSRSGEAAELSLEEFLAIVEAAHPGIRAAQYEPDLAEAEIRNALGRFDPDLSLNYTYKDSDGKDKLNMMEGSLKLPLNTVFSPTLKAEYRRGMGSSIDPENLTSPAGEASLGVSLPLFQGIFTDKRRNDLRKALLRPEIAQAQYRIERNALLRSAATAYWYWAESLAEVEVADSMLRLSQQRFDQVVARVRAGEVAPIDSVEIAQEVLRRQGQLYDALRKAEQARVDASVFLWSGDGAPRQVTEQPSGLRDSDTSVTAEEVVAVALRNRPELIRMQKMRELARYDSSLSREYLRPFIQAEAALMSYNVSTISSVDYKVGLTISQPLLFRSASAGAQAADIAVQRADLSMNIVERIVAADAQNSLIAFSRARDRVTAAASEVSLARRMVEAERLTLNAGESTLLQINLRERFYAEALLRLVKARGDAIRALVSLRWATGTI